MLPRATNTFFATDPYANQPTYQINQRTKQSEQLAGFTQFYLILLCYFICKIIKEKKMVADKSWFIVDKVHGGPAGRD